MNSKSKDSANAVAHEEGEEESRGQNDEALDQFWEKIRSFLAETTTIKQGLRRDEKSNRLAFQEACNIYDPKDTGMVPKKDLIRAFIAARLSFQPSDREWDKLISALDAWENREQ